jgi:hypothetical protein
MPPLSRVSRKRLTNDIKQKKKALMQQRELMEAHLQHIRRRGKNKGGRRTLILATVAILILVALLSRCSCSKTNTPPTALGTPASPGTPTPAARQIKILQPQKRLSMSGNGTKSRRDRFMLDDSLVSSWLAEFRKQVAGRSWRLQKCFDEGAGVGSVRWTTTLNPASGTVTAHQFEPLGSTSALSSSTHDCLVAVLANPSYELARPSDERLSANADTKAHETRSLQVSMVFEF